MSILISSQPQVKPKPRAKTEADEKVEKIIKCQLLRFARQRRLRCKNGTYIAVDKSGVWGTHDASDPRTELQVLSIGSDMLAVWGSYAGLYLAVDSTREMIYTTKEEGRHCVLIETLTPDFYNIYETYRSVYDGQPQCITMEENNKLELTRRGQLPGRNGQFMWEIVSEQKRAGEAT